MILRKGEPWNDTLKTVLGKNKCKSEFPSYFLNQGWQVLDGLGKNRLKPLVKTVRKKQVLDSQNGQNWSKL